MAAKRESRLELAGNTESGPMKRTSGAQIRQLQAFERTISSSQWDG